MRYFALVLLALPMHAEFLLQQSAFTSTPEGWSSWSHRAESMPRIFVDAHVSRGEPGSLAINGLSNAAAYGGWRKQIQSVKPGEWLRFKAFYKAESVTAENWQVVARLDWQTAAGKRAGDPDYLPWTRRTGEWSELTGEAQAPAGASSVFLELYLANAPQGTVWWDDISVERIPAPAARKVSVATVNLRPRNSAGREDSVSQFIQTIAKSVPAGTDVI